VLRVSDLLAAALEDGVKKPQLILEIDGLPAFGSIPVQKYLTYGDLAYYGDAGLYYGGLVTDEDILPYIDLTRSTQIISQQLMADKGGFSSVTNFDVALVDKDQEISALIKPTATTDVLSRKAKLYLSLEGAGHPQDSVLFFSGIVSGIAAGAGFVKFNLSSPEKLKNLELFPKVSTEVLSPVLAGDTTINVISTADFITAADALTTYLLINDEIISYTGKTATSFTGCTRAQYGTIAVGYAAGDNVESAYRLIGNLRDLSLKLMLSGINEDYKTGIDILGFNIYGALTVANAVFLPDYNIDDVLGVTIGDTATIVGGANAGAYLINSIVNTESGSYLVLNSTIANEALAGQTLNLKSKYAVLPKFAGLEMTPDQVDVQEFESKFVTFGASFFDYDFFIKDSVKGSEFINEQILYPSGCYAIPRKAKTSLGITTAPIVAFETKTIDWTNVISADGLVIDRSINNNFYNSVIYKYELDQVDDEYKRGKIRLSTDSTNRIKVANKPMTIAADGIRADAGVLAKFETISRRFLERYQFAAQSLDVKVTYGAGFSIEIGDVIIFQGSDLKVSDTVTGNRSFLPRLFEVVNKTLNIMGQPIQLKLLDTAFSLNGRYGVISPSSTVGTGSTSTVINLVPSWGTTIRTTSENYKWRSLVGQTLRFRSMDYTSDQESVLIGLDPTNENGIIISPALSGAPAAGIIVDVAKYGTGTDPAFNALTKAMFVFYDNQISVLTGVSTTSFTVSAGEVSKIAAGYLVKIHDKNYTYQSNEVEVLSVAGTTVTVSSTLGLTPAVGDKVELLGFSDLGKAYKIL